MPNYNPKLTLNESIKQMNGDPPSSIPFIVWLLENPASPIALPGNIDLYRHDCLHLLLDRGFSLNDEAFVVGFTMGNDVKTKRIHLVLLEVLSWLLYPKKYRFCLAQWGILELGFAYGRAIQTPNLNQLDFASYHDQTLSQLRSRLGISPTVLASFEQVEAVMGGHSS